MLAMAQPQGSQTNSSSWHAGGGQSSLGSLQKPPTSFQPLPHRCHQPHRTCSAPPPSLSIQQTSRAPHQEMGAMVREPSSLGWRPWEAGNLRPSVPREIVIL